MSYLPRSSSGSSVVISSIIKPVRFPSIFPLSRVWCCTHTPINQTQTAMEQLDPSKSSQVVVPHPHLLHAKISSIRMAGHSKLQIIADFDATLTKYWVNGCRGQSSHGLLQQGNPEYDVKRRELYDYYHPLEISPSIPIEEKAKLMEEWWGKTHALLIEGGLTYDAITKSVANSMITFREGVVELFEFLEARDIPVLIFSAGLADVIEETIHVLNKNEHALDMAGPLHDELGDSDGPNEDSASVKKRTNVLLLGDHIGDLGMSDGLDYETRISVGFLNDNVEKSLDSYRKAFDLVYLNDGPMWGVVKLVSQLCSTEGD
ncbi:7-methylguanosine phosphate-specific 5'-nucleotidase A isoform X3 [Vitis riparia]|uniref:7-methylguanosine phosphate-specific 5'-nucleotidase A isoform X3 n=1 Tax=Vitis riparia TaxID=96939 RepID=UPI00155A0A6F|nr:7-methylguanosine phosphate-specific 5'-nucleotidase A isoform X3 [Vitis riparia]